ncbi:MAG: type III polyketide synthase [Planctomycetes bacterium]|nr:type III polyketide synthase [Planctomycetota bacterium]
MTIASVGRALPPHRYSQREILAYLLEVWRDRPGVRERLPKLFENVRVRARHLALPLERYAALGTFGQFNDAWLGAALDLGEQATAEALQRAGIGPADVDAFFSVTVTGVTSPSLEARLMNRLPFRRDVKRTPIFGLGCVAGVAGVARAADYVRAFPDHVAVLLSVELCSLTFQVRDLSVPHLISTGLFGDGAAAVVVAGERAAERLGLRGPRVEATRSVFYPDSEDVMGWRVSEHGFELVLSASVPAVVRENIGPDVARFLAEVGVDRGEVGAWVCHPGGPKVLQAMQDSLDLTEVDVARSWATLAEQGNLSSTSVLMVLRDTLDAGPYAAGTPALLVAMGPAFCAELALVRF